MNDIHLTFPGGKRVDAAIGKHHVVTDQSLAHGGTDTAPEPFELFLASLATCAGMYVATFCQTRGIPTDWIELIQRHELNAEGQLSRIVLELRLPPIFPEKYRAAVVRAAEGCKVRKTLGAPPEVVVTAVVVPDRDAAQDTALE